MVKKRDKLKEELEQLPEEKHIRFVELYAILKLAQRYEKIVVSHYDASIQLFIRENTLTRKDGVTPRFFEDTPSENLTTYFQDIV